MYTILLFTCLIIAFILLFLLYRVRHAKIAKLLMICVVIASFWFLAEAASLYIKSDTLAIILHKLKFISVILLPPCYVIWATNYTNQKQWHLKELLALFFIPALSMLSLFTNFPYAFFGEIKRVHVEGVLMFQKKYEIGFYIHTVFSYINIVYVCTKFMFKALYSSRLYRKQSSFIFIGTAVTFLINFISIVFFTNILPIDYTAISILLTLIIAYWGIFRLPRHTMISVARELLVENLKVISFIVDVSNKIIDVNPAAREFIGKFSNGQFSAKKNINYIGIQLEEVLTFLPAQYQLEISEPDQLIVLTKDEQSFYFTEYKKVILDKDGAAIGSIYMLHDVTEMQEYVHRLELLNEELLISDRIISTAGESILITDVDGTILRINEAFEKMTGYSKHELIGNTPRMLKSGIHDKAFYEDMWKSIKEHGYWEGEIWDKRKDGKIYPKWMSITPLKGKKGIVENYISISTDISDMKKTEQQLYKLAYYDTLTKIPNRSMFYKKLEQAIVTSNHSDQMVVILCMDLDGFKMINDSLGHNVGDKLLKEVASRISACVKSSDTVFRIGGDEFTVILEAVKDLEFVKMMAEDIIYAIQQPYFVEEKEITLGISIGIAVAPHDETTVEGLVRKADAAMYDAKESGKGRYSFSSEEIERRNHEVLDMHIKLKKALEKNEFKLYLQPQISYKQGIPTLVGAEALIRWETSEGIMFTPDKFIPISENNGMIIPIGEWILDEILHIHQQLKDNNILIKLAINISTKQLEVCSFFSKIEEVMTLAAAQELMLEMEITESFLLDDIHGARKTIQEIQRYGIKIALDDFGTGFSSLNYLTRLPIDYLKIDKSFIDDIASDEQKSIVPYIISMAQALNIQTIAEGIETQEQMQKLADYGCSEMQGYYWGKPMPLETFISFAQQFKESVKNK
ncbi:EAL domain-containing protein [Lysinibacillus piscis]|uniref:EAL domain-containing protein n=1 Tax=Lysinibacillus piscis TaxID=2518931 RepID=A0ABQ5NP77_9BACI|nr:EAL domain-containing protein [Lysinibacillus sp. KH24]GLC89794.1 hypothetical protein LYSBPC_29210 [Lysinibacillus sp. KH24]